MSYPLQPPQNPYHASETGMIPLPKNRKLDSSPDYPQRNSGIRTNRNQDLSTPTSQNPISVPPRLDRSHSSKKISKKNVHSLACRISLLRTRLDVVVQVKEGVGDRK
ncbi:hypothetical protein JAAARDRAFT_61327 [Jaapia argillacea MUCL 33604]|uniref:Uncharacterized protein n=1 Tax=Jaapia argillacea MUCL 33604 TaxID=933084 RepID=A0A067PQQ3_9AGAM|nr:hypothetical protein JAAARDRAFT_61327 [Jaapia argillacea MUCL 33604]